MTVKLYLNKPAWNIDNPNHVNYLRSPAPTLSIGFLVLKPLKQVTENTDVVMMRSAKCKGWPWTKYTFQMETFSLISLHSWSIIGAFSLYLIIPRKRALKFRIKTWSIIPFESSHHISPSCDKQERFQMI